jgi:opacity protein-like surface antigen
MNIKHIAVVFALSGAVPLAVKGQERPDSRPVGLLGEGHALISARLLDLDDLNLDDAVGLSLRLNTGMGHNIDFFAQAGYAWSEKTVGGATINYKQMDLSGGLMNHFSPGEAINPFIGLAGLYRRTEVDETETNKENDFGVGFQFGFELAPVEPLYLRATIEYRNFGGDSELWIGGSAGFWIMDSTLLVGSYEADVENDRSEIKLGLAILY